MKWRSMKNIIEEGTEFFSDVLEVWISASSGIHGYNNYEYPMVSDNGISVEAVHLFMKSWNKSWNPTPNY